jgi:hypothetical protein
MIPVRAGELARNLQLYDVPGGTQDEYGQVSDEGQLIALVRGKVEHLRGRELQAAQQVYTSVTHKVTLRWLGSVIPRTPANPNGYILPRMYLVLEDGRRLDVVDANDVGEAHLYWILTCNEKVVT